RVDDAGGNGVDVDLVRGQRQGHRLGHADDTRLARTVRQHQRLAAASRLRRHVDDLPAPPLLDHHPRRSLAAPEHALAVDVEKDVPVLRGRLEKRDDPGHTRVVDQDVGPAQLSDRRSDRGLDLLLVAHVHGRGHRLAAFSSDIVGDLLRAGLGQVGDHHAGAFPRVADGDRLAHPAGRAGHDGNFAFELHWSPPLALRPAAMVAGHSYTGTLYFSTVRMFTVTPRPGRWGKAT